MVPVLKALNENVTTHQPRVSFLRPFRIGYPSDACLEHIKLNLSQNLIGRIGPTEPSGDKRREQQPPFPYRLARRSSPT
jgi:hypothetical protein